MIADTTFLIDLIEERRGGKRGPALLFFAAQRPGAVRTSVISLAEVAMSFPTTAGAWDYFKYWRIYTLHRGVVDAAVDIDRQLARSGKRLGENDNWIAGFGRYFREPIISRDTAFDRAPLLRRVTY